MPVVVRRRGRSELDLDVRMPLHEFLRDRLVELRKGRERVEHVERHLLRVRAGRRDRAGERDRTQQEASSPHFTSPRWLDEQRHARRVARLWLRAKAQLVGLHACGCAQRGRDSWRAMLT
jgi:hypothetical protein